MTLGIRPDRPETGYGYIIATGHAEKHEGMATFAVERFEEKPSRERAEELLAGGRALWNAGIFVWRQDALREGLRRHAPGVAVPIEDGLAARLPLAEIYGALPATLDRLRAAGAGVPRGCGVRRPGRHRLERRRQLGGAARCPSGEGGPARVVIDGPASTRGPRTSWSIRPAAGWSSPSGCAVPSWWIPRMWCSVIARERAQDVKRIVDRLAGAKENDHL